VLNFRQIFPVRAELFHADGRTDGRTNMTKLIVLFRNFANESKKGGSLQNTNFKGGEKNRFSRYASHCRKL